MPLDKIHVPLWKAHRGLKVLQHKMVSRPSNPRRYLVDIGNEKREHVGVELVSNKQIDREIEKLTDRQTESTRETRIDCAHARLCMCVCVRK